MVKHSAMAILIIGIAMAGTQYILAVSGMWTIGGFGASLVGLISGLAVAKLKIYNQTSPSLTQSEMGLWWALSAYFILIIIVSSGVMIPFVKAFLGQVKLTLSFPEIISLKGWVIKAGKGKAINIFGHGGALFILIPYRFYCLPFKGLLSSTCVKNNLTKNCEKRCSDKSWHRQHGLFCHDHGSLPDDIHPCRRGGSSSRKQHNLRGSVRR